jgi:hypothetical protein
MNGRHFSCLLSTSYFSHLTKVKTSPKYTNKKVCFNKCNRSNVKSDIPTYSSVLIHPHFRLNWVKHQEEQKLFLSSSNPA